VGVRKPPSVSSQAPGGSATKVPSGSAGVAKPKPASAKNSTASASGK
jgi:hypothetical protein